MVRGNQKGMALVLAIMLLLVLFVMGSTLLMMTTTDVRIAGHQMRDNRALFVADAGIQEVLARITSDTLYIGDTVGYVRGGWQSEIYAGTPPAGSGDTLRFRALLGDTGLKYGDATAPVIVHYLKDRNGDVVYHDPETKKRFVGSSVAPDCLPIYVAEATGLEPSGGYPIRRKAITEFVISSADYSAFDYALHTGRGITLKGMGRLSTFSGSSDKLRIMRNPADSIIFVDMNNNNVWDLSSEVCIFEGGWSDTFNLMQLSRSSPEYPPPGDPTQAPDLGDIGNNGRVFANGNIELDEGSGEFWPKFGDTWAVGDTNNWSGPWYDKYMASWNPVTDSLRVPQIDMSLDYWKYQGAKIMERIFDPDSLPDGWEQDKDGYHWRPGDPSLKMKAGLYYFADMPVTIDSSFTADGDVSIVTPFSVVINRDVTYSEGEPKVICFMAGTDVILTGNVLVKAVLYAKSGDVKIMNEAAILGAVFVGGQALISGECAIFLDERLNASGFTFVDPDKKYVSTVLSWREVKP